MYLRIFVATVLGLTLPLFASPVKGDLCHVYLVNKAAALKAQATGNQNDLERSQLIYPVFETSIGEEELTTKHYRVPQSNLVITATVLYTDESMASSVGKDDINANSMLLGIVVTRKKEFNAIASHLNNAVTEVGYDNNLGNVRVKKYLIINKKMYLVGLECDCNAKRRAKE